MKSFIILLPLIFSAHPKAQGTLVVLLASQNKIIVAGDSRVTFLSRQSKMRHDDSYCKIATLDGKFVFSGTGRDGHYSSGHPEFTWDSKSIARTLANKTPLSIKSLATSWATEVSALHTRDSRRGVIEPENLALPIIQSVIFAGLENGVPTGYNVVIRKITRKNKYLAYSPEITAIDLKPGEIYPLGRIDIALEFSAQKTLRSHDWMAEFNQGYTWDSAMVPIAQKVISLTEQYSRDKEDVGGAIDVVQIDAAGTRWLDKKERCGN